MLPVWICRWLVLAMAMMRFYIQKGTHKGLYRSIARTLKFFQTFALVEVRTISTSFSFKEPSWSVAVIEGPNKGLFRRCLVHRSAFAYISYTFTQNGRHLGRGVYYALLAMVGVLRKIRRNFLGSIIAPG